MKCMYCGCVDSKVVDSRTTEDGTSIRRRRECINCGRRFTTYETVENTTEPLGSYVPSKQSAFWKKKDFNT